MTKAAVLTRFGAPLDVVELDLDPPGPGEVEIRLAASGVCHTDAAMQSGVYPFPTPIVLGHEGAGTVTAVGAGVDKVAPGDHVALAWIPQCGICRRCVAGQAEFCEIGATHMLDGGLLDGTRRWHGPDGEVAQAGYLGTFSEATVVPEACVVPIPEAVPFEVAALLGCAVLTGVGAARNTARVRRGDVVAVVGCGGVGLNAVQGARLAGAERIVAIDVVADKLDLARRLGATDTVDATSGEVAAACRALTAGAGVDVGIEVTGMPAALASLVDGVRRGGTVVIVGQHPMDSPYPTPVGMMNLLGHRILPSVYGGSDVARDIPRLVDEYLAGQLLLDELVSSTLDLGQVNEALASLDTAGPAARTVIRLAAP